MENHHEIPKLKILQFVSFKLNNSRFLANDFVVKFVQ